MVVEDFKPDLAHSFNSHVHGAVQCFMNWTPSKDGHTLRPAMYFRKALGGRTIAVLPYWMIAEVMENTGYAMLGIVSLGAQIAEQVGFQRLDRFAAKDVADLILEHCDECLHMPSEPGPEYGKRGIDPAPNAEIRMRVGEEVVNVEEIRV